jgi:hypothetical protein
MQALPEFVGLFQNPVFGPNLNIPDHFSGKMIRNQGA